MSKNKVVQIEIRFKYMESMLHSNFRDDAPRCDDGLTGDSMSFR